MKIHIAEHAGTCFGVDNAIKIAFEATEREKNLHILGDLVHNPQTVKQLLDRGVQVVDDIKQLSEGDNLIIRAHGENKATYAYCKKNNINIIDCTCPFVRRTQVIASQLDNSGYKVVLIGDADHPEVRGIAAQAKDPIIVSNAEQLDAKSLNGFQKLGVLAQTTQRKENFEEIVKGIISNNRETKVFNTICSATTNRQQAALKICDEVDLMIVIGGRNSANTKRLNEICSQKIKTHWITDAAELENQWFKNIKSVGITAGASTPEIVIQQILKKIKHHTEY